MEWQVSQPEAERVTLNQDQTSARPLVSWGPDEKSWSQNPSCRQVGNQIICDDIYGDNKPAVSRCTFSTGGNDTFRSITALQASMGLIGQAQIVRAGDSAAPPYYPAGTLPNPALQTDRYSYNQGTDFNRGAVAAEPRIPVNPYSFHQGDQASNPGIVPPYIRPNGHEVPRPPVPGPLEQPKPVDVPAPPKPQPKPETTNPCPTNYSPCNPCQPRQGWHPGMIAGRVLGRVFGRGRCR
jgi:hypothetical protein